MKQPHFLESSKVKEGKAFRAVERVTSEGGRQNDLDDEKREHVDLYFV
jgi:hypothetical protein